MKNKNLDKIKQLEILLVKFKYANNPNKLQSALEEINKIQIVNKNLHEIKKGILLDYIGEFEMVGNLKVGDQIRQTHIRFRTMDDFEAHINSLDEGHDADDAIFSRYNYKLNTPQFNLVNRSRYGNGFSFDKTIVQYRRNNCYIPTEGYCFVICVNFLTGQYYKDQYLEFIQNEKRRSKITEMARIQPCLRKLGVDLGYYNGERVFPGTVMKRDSALYLYNNHFCLIRKSQNVTFNQAIRELEDNFKKVGIYIT